MRHFDGSLCEHKQKMPSKADIARYWKEEKCYKYLNYCMDRGEPSCWSCNKWFHKYDMDLDMLKEVFLVWNNHSYLDRCHILPRVLGGCNCEANFVLPCTECHKASPDTKNTGLFIKWVRHRKSWFYHVEKELKQVCEEFEYLPTEGDCAIIMSEGFKDFMFKNGVIVGGRMSWATRIACLIEYKEVIKTSQDNPLIC